MIPAQKVPEGKAIWGQSSDARPFRPGSILLSTRLMLGEEQRICTMMSGQPLGVPESACTTWELYRRSKIDLRGGSCFTYPGRVVDCAGSAVTRGAREELIRPQLPYVSWRQRQIAPASSLEGEGEDGEQ